MRIKVCHGCLACVERPALCRQAISQNPRPLLRSRHLTCSQWIWVNHEHRPDRVRHQESDKANHQHCAVILQSPAQWTVPGLPREGAREDVPIKSRSPAAGLSAPDSGVSWPHRNGERTDQQLTLAGSAKSQRRSQKVRPRTREVGDASHATGEVAAGFVLMHLGSHNHEVCHPSDIDARGRGVATHLMIATSRRRCKLHPHGDMIAASPARLCPRRWWLRDPSRSRLFRRRERT